MILAGDIGGTKVNLACYSANGGQLEPCVSASYASRSFPSLDAIVHTFFSEHRVSVRVASFGVAGPVRRGRSSLPNLKWNLDATALAQNLNLETVWLLNDLEANAHGIAGLTSKDFIVLNEGEADPRGNAAIISAGTGLGEAGLYWDGARHRPIASEGGHSDFAARTDLDVELFRFLRAELGHVSWERVLSGPGLFNIYRFLRDTGRGLEPNWLHEQIQAGDAPAAIASAALDGRCALCQQALDLFVKYYAAEASNLGLKVMSTGGLYIGGGIAPKIISRLTDRIFMKEFCESGRMSGLLEAMPVRVILNEKTALLGAALFAAEALRNGGAFSTSGSSLEAPGVKQRPPFLESKPSASTPV